MLNERIKKKLTGLKETNLTENENFDPPTIKKTKKISETFTLVTSDVHISVQPSAVKTRESVNAFKLQQLQHL